MSDPILTPITPAQTEAQETRAVHENILEKDLIDVDIFTSELTGDKVQDETLSSRWARGAEEGNKADEVLSRALDVFQKDHGVKAQAGDLARAEQVEAIEKESGYLDK